MIGPLQGPIPDNTQHSAMTPAGFEPAIPASQRPHTHPFDNAATVMGNSPSIITLFSVLFNDAINSEQNSDLVKAESTRMEDWWQDTDKSTRSKKGKAIPLQAWTGPEGSRRLRFPDFKTIGTWRWQGCQPYAPAAFSPRKYSRYSFLLETESTPGP